MTLSHPSPAQLQTGDLLFPRLPGKAYQGEGLSAQWGAPMLSGTSDMRLREYLGQDAIEMLQNEAQHYDVSALLAEPDTRSPLFAPLGPKHPDSASQRKREMLLLVILWRAFPTLLKSWLDMTVTQFLQHPLRSLLVGALDRETGGGFFVGHVGMVLRERDGVHAPEGPLWVIEANTTDFSHYRVALHRYLVEGEPTAFETEDEHALPRLRGWANRRLALGQSIWHSRHATLHRADAHALALQQRLVDVAKSYLGRPYGFFDDPTFGDAGRMYCGEYVHRVFEDTGGAGLRVDHNRRWAWLYDHLDALGSQDFGDHVRQAVQADGLYARMQDRPFFLLTLHMLYRSEELVHLHQPDGMPYA